MTINSIRVEGKSLYSDVIDTYKQIIICFYNCRRAKLRKINKRTENRFNVTKM